MKFDNGTDNDAPSVEARIEWKSIISANTKETMSMIRKGGLLSAPLATAMRAMPEVK